MPRLSFEFDCFSDDFTLAADADGTDWPAMEATLDFVFHPPEPDVGIFHRQVELRRVTYALNGEQYDDEAKFVAAVYDAITGDIEESEDAVAEAVRRQVALWEAACDDAEDE